MKVKVNGKCNNLLNRYKKGEHQLQLGKVSKRYNSDWRDINDKTLTYTTTLLNRSSYITTIQRKAKLARDINEECNRY